MSKDLIFRRKGQKCFNLNGMFSRKLLFIYLQKLVGVKFQPSHMFCRAWNLCNAMNRYVKKWLLLLILVSALITKMSVKNVIFLFVKVLSCFMKVRWKYCSLGNKCSKAFLVINRLLYKTNTRNNSWAPKFKSIWTCRILNICGFFSTAP